MNLAWLAEFVFFLAYFIAWVTDELPHSLWITISAIAAVILAILLIADNYRTWNRPA